MAAELPSSLRSVRRFAALLAALRDGPLPRPALLARLGAAYPSGDSARRELERDIGSLAQLGITISKTDGRPPLYTLHGGTPVYSADDLRALALVRGSFGDRHPQAAQIRSLLAALTAGLGAEERALYEQRQATSAPLQPAIDYTPHHGTIERLQHAISAHELIAFAYRNSQGATTQHRKVEPYEIEFYDRHFYLVAYSHNSGQMHEFRVDRISGIDEVQRLPRDHVRERPTITFRYRLAAHLARGEISQRFTAQRVVERRANGDVVIEAEGRNAFFIVRTLLKYAGSAELLAEGTPPELMAQMRRDVAALAGLYGVDDGR